jgi:hypothetical protein
MSSFTDGSMNIMMSTMLLLCSQKSGVSRFNQAQKIRPGRAEVLAARSQRARVLPQLARGARCCAPGCPEQQLSGVADSVGRLSRRLSRCVVRSLQHLVCLRQLASGTSRDASVSAQGRRLFAQAVAGCAVYLRESHRRRSVCAIFGVVRGRDVGVALAGEPEVGELRLIGSRSRLHPQHPPRLGDADLRRAACGVSSTLRGQRGLGPASTRCQSEG